ncbi:MAG: class II fructose-bisphosphate aldolase [Firmicutes bacterium]|nr:class II fructose-bisphosphate aldolase [Bacillota bacterium]
MKSRNFVQELRYAREHRYAVGAFNIFNYLSARAVIHAATTMSCSVILQTSAATVKHFGPQELGTMLRQLAWNAPVNVLVHLDHCTDPDLARACIDCGWDGVMYDGSQLPLEDNIANCRQIVAYAHHRGVMVEGEIGKISGVEDDIQVDAADAAGAGLEESLYFLEQSGVDALAPAIGTAHGVYTGAPKINFDLVRELAQRTDVPIVIHGGTGLAPEVFRALISLGASKINVSTAIKQAYVEGCTHYLERHDGKFNPLDFDQEMNCSIKDVAMAHMRIFHSGEGAAQ